MALYPINKEGTGIDKSAENYPTNWDTAMEEMTRFKTQFPGEEDMLIMDVESLRTLLNRADYIKNNSNHKVYIACMFGKGPSRYNSMPIDKLTTILFPVIYTGDAGTSGPADYQFFEENGVLDRDNSDYIQQTWIDPTSRNEPAADSNAINHFNGQQVDNTGSNIS